MNKKEMAYTTLTQEIFTNETHEWERPSVDHHAAVRQVLAVQGGGDGAVHNRRDAHKDERHPSPAPDQDALPHRASQPVERPVQSAPRE